MKRIMFFLLICTALIVSGCCSKGQNRPSDIYVQDVTPEDTIYYDMNPRGTSGVWGQSPFGFYNTNGPWDTRINNRHDSLWHVNPFKFYRHHPSGEHKEGYYRGSNGTSTMKYQK